MEKHSELYLADRRFNKVFKLKRGEETDAGDGRLIFYWNAKTDSLYELCRDELDGTYRYGGRTPERVGEVFRDLYLTDTEAEAHRWLEAP